MMSVVEFLSQPVWHRLSLTLVHFLWQGVVLATITCAAVRVLRLKHGNPRYATFLLALIAMAVCPLITFLALRTPVESTAITPEPIPTVESAGPVPSSMASELPQPLNEDPVAVSPTHHVPLREKLDDMAQAALPWALACWMGGVVALSIRLLLGFIGVSRWRRGLEPLPGELAARVHALSERLGLPGFSRVFLSGRALGYLRPTVLLPAAMVTHMPPEMLEAVIAHELAHIRRFDLWVNLAQRVIETLLFYHPAVWWLSNRLRAERELCCDELAVRATGERLAYASALESAGRVRLGIRQPALAVALGQDRRSTLSRVRHVLGLPPAYSDSRFWLAGVIAVILLALLAMPAVPALTASAATQTASESRQAPEPAKSIHQAAADGNLEQVNKLLAQGADIHAKDENGRTPLHAAAWYARKDVVAVLLAHGASINEADGSGQTPLHLAANFGGKPVPELLLAHGAQIDARDKAGNTPLHAAAGFAGVSEDLLELLIDKGADVKAKNQAGQTPLHRVSTIRRLDYPIERTAEILLAHGAEVDAKDQSGCTPLHFAVEHGNKKLVDLLVAKGADVKTKAADGTTLLHQAVKSEQLDMLELFLNQGIDVNSARSDGWTALHLALAARPSANRINVNSIVEALIARGADVKARDVRGNTPVQIAISYGHHRKDTVRLLLDKGVEVSTIQVAAYLGDLGAVKGFLERGGTVNAQDGDWRLSPLGAAALGGQKDVAAFLISHGASVNAEQEYGMTALHCAAAGGSKDVAELLIANGAKVDAKTQGGGTPLGTAASWGAKDVVLLLIDRGADVNAGDVQTRPLDAAVRAGREDVAKLLADKGADTSQDDLLFWACTRVDKDQTELVIRKGANVNSQAWGYAPALEAMWSGYTKATKPPDIPRLLGVLELLLEHGADPDAKDRWDWSLLHYACGNVDLTKLLLDRGASPNVRTCGGRTPLHFVADKGDKAVTQLLLGRGADVNAKDSDGRTPLSYAEDLGDNDMWGHPRKTPLTAEAKAARKEVARILREHGAKEDAPGRPGNIKPKEGAAEATTRAEAGDAEEVKPPLIGSEKPAKSLHQAAADGDLEQVRLLISAGTNVNQKDKDGLTALHRAIEHGHQTVVELLIAKGADSNAGDRHETTPLHAAASAGHQEITQLLLSSGADANAQQGGSRLTPLHFACWHGHAEVAKLLIQKGARLEATDKAGYPPLYYSLWYEHNTTTRVLVAHGADVNFAPKGDWPPLYYALSSNDKGLVGLLLDNGVRAPALHLAAFQGNLARVRSLCAGGIDVDSRDDILNWTPLSWAVSGGQRDTAEFLIVKGADVNAKAADDYTPLRQAAYVGSKESVELLLAHGGAASIGKPLHGAAQRGHVSVVEILIAQGADTDARDERGRTPLICACGSKQTKVSEVLIGKGADTNAKDDAGRTALHSACATGLRDVVELLISKGTDINVREKAGRSPLVYAQDNGYPEIADLLRKHGAKE